MPIPRIIPDNLILVLSSQREFLYWWDVEFLYWYNSMFTLNQPLISVSPAGPWWLFLETLFSQTRVPTWWSILRLISQSMNKLILWQLLLLYFGINRSNQITHLHKTRQLIIYHIREKCIFRVFGLWAHEHFVKSTPDHNFLRLSVRSDGGCFTNISRALQTILSKFVYYRNCICYENSKPKLCTCAQSHALGTHTKFQLEILTTDVISGIVYFHEIILKSKTLETQPPGQHLTQSGRTPYNLHFGFGEFRKA